MNITKVCETNCFQNVHGVDARNIFDSNDAQVIHMALGEGQSLKSHTTPVDVFFYILEGTGAVEIGDMTQNVEKDTLIDSPKGIPHLLRNTGKGVFRFLVVKLPKTK
jgi:mannose-6-phosphate isomerase-like protein (cupin superfamily)